MTTQCFKTLLLTAAFYAGGVSLGQEAPQARANEPVEAAVEQGAEPSAARGSEADVEPEVAPAVESSVEQAAPSAALPVLQQTAESVTASRTRLSLDTTQVTGNRELPKVLVIVPWKNPELVELTGRPLASLVEEALSPIDPAVFRRQVDYYNALQDDADDGDN